MKIKINLKQPGKKRNTVRQETYTISDGISNLRDLIIDIVTDQVSNFNKKVDRGEIISYLTSEEIRNNADVGKVGFGEIANDKKQEIDKAVQNALQSFEDGVYCVFIDDEQKESLDEEIHITEETVLTFIRLTMLAGRMW